MVQPVTVETADRGEDELSVVRRVSLTRALEKHLERLITEGELAPGERLNENQLALRFGTSRGPLREATRTLEAKGFLESVRNRGVFVRQLTLHEALEIYDLRAALFGLAGRLVAQRMNDAILRKLTDLVNAMEEVAAQSDFEAYYPLNLSFHGAIVEASGNETLVHEYQRFVKKMHLYRERSLVQGGGLAVSNREHAEMLASLAAGDPDRAHTTHWLHVERAKHRLISAVEPKKQ